MHWWLYEQLAGRGRIFYLHYSRRWLYQYLSPNDRAPRSFHYLGRGDYSQFKPENVKQSPVGITYNGQKLIANGDKYSFSCAVGYKRPDGQPATEEAMCNGATRKYVNPATNADFNAPSQCQKIVTGCKVRGCPVPSDSSLPLSAVDFRPDLDQ